MREPELILTLPSSQPGSPLNFCLFPNKMPEGPEVRTVADKLRPLLVGKEILKIVIDERAKQTDLRLIEKRAIINEVTSHGKKLFFWLSSGQIIVTSFGMEGRWLINKTGSHSHILLSVGHRRGKEELQLVYDDTRYFGSVCLITDYDKFISRFGPDPLAEDISPETWSEIFRRKKGQICAVLLDQEVISGVGNYLKSEILYRARIRPDRKVEDLTDEELERIRVETHNAIRESYRHGGLTIRSFWAPDGSAGVFPVQVYNRDYDPEGNEVVRSKCKDGRTTFWVPTVQK